MSSESDQHTTSDYQPREPEVPRAVVFDELSDGRREIIIEHNGQQYRLRSTRNGRLILNK